MCLICTRNSTVDNNKLAISPSGQNSNSFRLARWNYLYLFVSQTFVIHSTFWHFYWRQRTFQHFGQPPHMRILTWNVCDESIQRVFKFATISSVNSCHMENMRCCKSEFRMDVFGHKHDLHWNWWKQWLFNLILFISAFMWVYQSNSTLNCYVHI